MPRSCRRLHSESVGSDPPKLQRHSFIVLRSFCAWSPFSMGFQKTPLARPKSPLTRRPRLQYPTPEPPAETVCLNLDSGARTPRTSQNGSHLTSFALAAWASCATRGPRRRAGSCGHRNRGLGQMHRTSPLRFCTIHDACGLLHSATKCDFPICPNSCRSAVTTTTCVVHRTLSGSP